MLNWHNQTIFKFKVKYPAASWRGTKLVTQLSCGVFDPRDSRRMDVQAHPLGSLLAGIKYRTVSSGNFSTGYRCLPVDLFYILYCFFLIRQPHISYSIFCFPQLWYNITSLMIYKMLYQTEILFSTRLCYTKLPK